MKNICIKNAKIILDNSILDGDLTIENGKIADFGSHLKIAKDSTIIDANKAYLSPAFIDIHCHGTCGADFSSGKISDFEIITKQKLSEGVAKILPTSLCMPFQDLKAFMLRAKEYALKNTYAKVEAVHLEGSFIAKEMCGAQNEKHCRNCDINEIDELGKIFKIAKVSYSLECDNSDGYFAKALADRNIVASAAHTKASFSSFEKAHSLGLKNITHFFNRCSPMNHKDLGVVGAGLYFDDVYLELICDLAHIDKNALSLVLKIKDNSKLIAVSDSILLANMPEGIYEMAGVKVELKEGLAKIYNTKNLAGSTIKMNDTLRILVEDLKLDIAQAVKMLSKNPAKSLNIESTCIEKGNFANLTLFDKAFDIKSTIVDGVIKYQKSL